VVVTCTPDGPGDSGAGLICSSVVCTILDAAAGYAVVSMLAPGQGHAFLDMKVNYVESCCRGNILTAVGTVTKFGPRIAFAEAVATDAYGDVIATAITSAAIFEV
jgi:acyl-coenzyme A thioesterase PaaI-like protein